MRHLLKLAAILGLCATTALAQDSAEILKRMKAMEERINALETELRTLKGERVAQAAQPAAPVAPPPVEMPPPPQPPRQLGGAGGAAAKVLNPDVSVIGDFLGAAGKGGPNGQPSLEMHESELGLQAILDPYARADFFISFGQQGVNLEEGYITFTALPYGLQLRAGKMRAAFGKVNTLHNHVLPWTDRPLVTQNLVGGEDGINDAGLSLSRILPAPKGIFLEGTAQVFKGDSEGVFAARNRKDLSAVGHLRGYHDFSESTNLDLGASYARGHSAFSDSSNQLYGLDATLRWKPLRRAIYHSFIARSEFIWGRARQGQLDASGLFAPSLGVPLAPIRFATPISKPFGYYASGDFQIAQRWFVGGRFDRSDELANAALQDTGGSAVLTFWPSEFSQIRTQFRRTRYGDKLTANELLFQFQFSIGAHGAHPF
jgi:hypothetical protein